MAANGTQPQLDEEPIQLADRHKAVDVEVGRVLVAEDFAPYASLNR